MKFELPTLDFERQCQHHFTIHVSDGIESTINVFIRNGNLSLKMINEKKH